MRCRHLRGVGFALSISGVLLLFSSSPNLAGSSAELTPAAILGKVLFHSRSLSSMGTVSCATCHDPARSFTDGRKQSVGVLRLPVGRNAPTLFGVGERPGFADPLASPRVSRRTVLTLAERCLVPLKNSAEMGDSISAAVARLRQEPYQDALFDHVFGTRRGVTAERVGAALAAYLMALGPPPSRYRRYLQGDDTALDPVAKRGLAIFNGRGTCRSCHTGPGLSDGLFHVVRLPQSRRSIERGRNDARVAAMFRQIREARNRNAGRAQPSPITLPGGYGGGGAIPDVATTSLWAVAETAPYFRDGSVASLEEALREHIADLRQVAGEEFDEFRVPVLGKPATDIDRRDPLGSQVEAIQRHFGTPRALVGALPEEVELPSDGDIRDLLAFLRTLSPS